MSSVLGLTTFDQIRGVLAVSPADLPDAILTPYGLEDDLLIDLSDWLDDWEATLEAGDRNTTLLKLYAKYRCAAWVAAAGQNFTLTSFTDGANAGQRSDTEGFQKLRDHLESRAGQFRQQLNEALNQTTGTVVNVMGRVVPTRDPVTQGRT